VNTTPVTYQVHTDHLGRPIRMTDAAKATVWQATWKPWGEAQSITGTAANNLRFPGQYFQIETGLAYNWHRHYDPVTGRYTQPDPLRFVDGPRIYHYAMASPFMRIDRNGLDESFWDFGGNGRSGPRNGNWGGGCWSGGQSSCGPEGSGKLPPTDSADTCYMNPDNCYEKCGAPHASAKGGIDTLWATCIRACNKNLVDALNGLPDDPRAWPHPPRSGTEDASDNFRDGAVGLFSE
jgi:RHS repeat-associated protein